MDVEKLAFMMGAKKFSKPIANSCDRWGITDPRDQARFISQLYVESNGFSTVEENLRYSERRLVEVFKGRNGLTPAIARKLVAKGPQAIANFVYGGDWGRRNLGNTQPNDGWYFRGMSLIQTTGRDNYLNTSIGCWGDQRLMHNPELLLLPDYAADAAGWYWHTRHLNGITSVKEVTRRINPGLLHLNQRVAQTNRAYGLVEFLSA